MRSFNCLYVFGVLIVWLICEVRCWRECCKKKDQTYFLNNTLPEGCTRTCAVEDTVIVDEDGELYDKYVKSYQEDLLILIQDVSFTCLVNCLVEGVSESFTCTDECSSGDANPLTEDGTCWNSLMCRSAVVISVIAIIIIIIIIGVVIHKREFVGNLCCKKARNANSRDPEVNLPLQEDP